MEAQTFELKTPYLKTGRSHNILAQTDLINVDQRHKVTVNMLKKLRHAMTPFMIRSSSPPIPRM
jgi:hypothetical protein